MAGNGEDLITITDGGVAFAKRRWASLEAFLEAFLDGFLDGFMEACSGGGEVLDNARLRRKETRIGGSIGDTRFPIQISYLGKF